MIANRIIAYKAIMGTSDKILGGELSVIMDGILPSPPFGVLTINATNILFAICTPIAVSNLFSPNVIIPRVNPIINACITISTLVRVFAPLGK